MGKICSYSNIPADKENIKTYLDKRLESLENTQQQTVHDFVAFLNESLESLEYTIIRHQTNESFLTPAHNCSRIIHYHPGATSGNISHIVIYWF